MRSITRGALSTGFVLMGIGAAAGQAPVRPAVLITEVPSGPFAGSARSPRAVIERLVSFDANKDRLVSRDELPERMQGLVARGDRNADAALDAEEINALVAAASSERIRVAFRPQPSDGLVGVVGDLRLSPDKHVAALALVNDQKVPLNLKEATNSELFTRMRALLDQEEYENFVAAAARLSRRPSTISGNVGGLVIR